MSAPRVTSLALWRRLLSGFGAMLGMAGFVRDMGSRDLGKIAVPLVALSAAIVAIHVPRLGAQLFARAAWWANFGLGTILCVVGNRGDMRLGLPLSLACGVALLVVGQLGLAEASERSGYAPSASRGALLLMMILALADAQTFLLFALLDKDRGTPSAQTFALFLFAASLLLLVGFVGLLRLSLWGVLVNVATCLAVLLAAAFAFSEIDWQLREVLIALSALQLAVATPMLVSWFSGRAMVSPPPWARAWIGRAVIVVVLLGSAVRFALL